MQASNFDELTGRIDGLAQAVLRVAAWLEMEEIIDGPRMSDAWRQARPETVALDVQRQASRRVLLQMAQELDAARVQRGLLQSAAYSGETPACRG